MITPFQLAEEIYFVWRRAAIITVAFTLAFMIEYFVRSETECDDEVAA